MSYSLNSTDADCYKGTTVLINKLGIKDEAELDRNERVITGFKTAELITMPLKPGFDFNDYKLIHRELFSELYDWAGCIRTISLSKNATVFTAPEKIAEIGNAIFKRLKECNYFVGMTRADFVREAAELYDALNRLHPIREGNGRTERIFFSRLIRNAGFDIDFSAANADLLMIGSIQAASGVMDNLLRFFEDNIKE